MSDGVWKFPRFFFHSSWTQFALLRCRVFCHEREKPKYKLHLYWPAILFTIAEGLWFSLPANFNAIEGTIFCGTGPSRKSEWGFGGPWVVSTLLSCVNQSVQKCSETKPDFEPQTASSRIFWMLLHFKRELCNLQWWLINNTENSIYFSSDFNT